MQLSPERFVVGNPWFLVVSEITNIVYCLRLETHNVSGAVSVSVFIWKVKRGESSEASVPSRD